MEDTPVSASTAWHEEEVEKQDPLRDPAPPRCRSLRTPANVLVTNLAVSDLLLLLNLVVFIYNSVHRGPALGVPGCQVYGFVGGLTGTVSIATLTAIAVDRYCVIVHPLRGRGRSGLWRSPRARARVGVCAAWLYGAVWAAPPLTGAAWAGRYVPEGFLTSCSFDYLQCTGETTAYIVSFGVAAWLLPLALISCCYCAICRAALRAKGDAAQGHDGRHTHSAKRRTELRLAAVVAGVVGLWFVSWTPYAVVSLLGVLGLHGAISPLGSMLPALFCKTASCLDPFLYAVTHPRFRRELATLLRRPRQLLQRRWHCGWAWGRHRPAIHHGGLRFSVAPPCSLGPHSGFHTGVSHRRPSETSEMDVEEVMVMVDLRSQSQSQQEDSWPAPPQQAPSAVAGAAARPGALPLAVAPFPPPASRALQPPSWFAPPLPHVNRRTSLRRGRSR
ncbi:opsin, ultraviolet-sensitive-like [Schistocerca gregaria]|uniref:opsin, ultraviolet-sensitive-like n=1 Tax=Schistocerca gregaria TaxID=7010 RepID=UPI00211DB95D|nr:opsin, ultraviolet-sensitive-like [Schistocerca gregaria]